MPKNKVWPRVGEILIHRFRKKEGSVEAKVTSVDEAAGTVRVRIDGKEYSSLSAAGQAIQGYAVNGWIYWGLKKQSPYKR